MVYRILILMLLAGSVEFLKAQSTADHILWIEGKELTWENFQANPESGHFASALSNITFSIKIKTFGNRLYVFIRPTFDPHRSWVKGGDKSDYLLKHEQLHFDISELTARKFRRDMQKASFNRKNAESKINRIVKKYTKKNVREQKKYDRQTKHSLRINRQEKWNAKVSSQLAELKEYDKFEFYIELQ